MSRAALPGLMVCLVCVLGFRKLNKPMERWGLYSSTHIVCKEMDLLPLLRCSWSIW